jgi:D-alanyl-D-alanine carboxypeptidase/D-alanyl-D-alanine-endopeptidase (penicillin-binding protein 4)
VSRLARAAWLSLALLSMFTISAGAAVVHLLPARLALFRLSAVAQRSLAAGGPVLQPVPGAPGVPGSTGPASSGGAPPGPGTGQGSPAPAGTPGSSPSPASLTAISAAGVHAALSPALDSLVFGPHKAAVVTDLSTGQLLFSQDAGATFAPASTAKLAIAVAALDVLGPAGQLRTRVVTGRSRSSIVLIGGGDPTLTAAPEPASDYPQPASLASLARQTAAALRARHTRRVKLSYATSLFTGPELAPGWLPSYVSTGNVTPIQSLEVDQGRLTSAGAPQDTDDPGNFRARSATPAADAAAAFAAFLSRDGIRVRGAPRPAAAGRGRATLASVASPPVAQIVQWMLMESNNVIAENLARQVAVATGHPASFRGAAAAERAVLRQAGLTKGISLVDGSGLSPDDRISPDALVKLVTLAASPGQPNLRAAITGLPVAGFAGTLAPGGSVFGNGGPAGLGLVRAKTGNLTTVAAIAGIAYAGDGQLLAFAFMADHLPAKGLDAAGAAMAGLATTLAGCGCH